MHSPVATAEPAEDDFGGHLKLFDVVYVKLKDRKRSLSRKKKTTTCCGITETATTRNFVLRQFLNNHDAG